MDGNAYIEYMCAYGPMIVGYNNPEVERAVSEQKRRVELAERMVELIAAAFPTTSVF